MNFSRNSLLLNQAIKSLRISNLFNNCRITTIIQVQFGFEFKYLIDEEGAQFLPFWEKYIHEQTSCCQFVRKLLLQLQQPTLINLHKNL